MTDSANAARTSRPAAGPPAKRNLFARIALFVRQVIAELKKVVRPTRSELMTYTAVVIVFVLAVMLYVGVLDFGIGKLVLWVFGRDSA
ncbi:preprotein translocase, SecE subunit [Beutenbergia cavernae DSM 12333]|uniref:Protein translocase subunit SecE n=1 Tax=Beutenbergia cavernae (strain ATCC BAA-8 / DSM 12333 / CCUG 43141 / JCM 11478 / NBRC 16432 / NCIMB 13614 / HKI 0122) TaxID=471853 RepID=C5C0L1_BEUC1|nr:preprotein translocase subunit SecE [Beutenbergia cavernae]ACQ81407.1 preprotein translocase, SecE subunit [Beutenbergia cavernae DSM 12333]